MDAEPCARGRQLAPKFAALNISIPGAAAWNAKYNRASLPPLHIVIEDLISLSSHDSAAAAPLDALRKFNCACGALAAHPRAVGGQVQGALLRAAAQMAALVATRKLDAEEFCASVALLCCNVLAHLSQEEEAISEQGAQLSLLQLLTFIAECMSKPHLRALFFESFGSKGFVSLLVFCEECAAHALSVDASSQAGSSLLEFMWSLHSAVASVFVSAAACDIDESHFQNFVSQASNALMISKDHLQMFRRPSDLTCVMLKIASICTLHPPRNKVISFLVQCIDVALRLRTMFLNRGQVDILLSFLDCLSSISEYSSFSRNPINSSTDSSNCEGTILIEDAIRTSTFEADTILPNSCFIGADRIIARWIADDLTFCKFVAEHFHEKILSKCAPTLELLQRLNTISFEQFQVIWMKAVSNLCDSNSILKTKSQEISQCISIVNLDFALKIIGSSATAFASNSSADQYLYHLKSLHILAHYRSFPVMDAVLNALWDCIRFRCQSTLKLDEALEILQNAHSQFCLAKFNISHTATLVSRLFVTLSTSEPLIEAIFACQVLYFFIDNDECERSSNISFETALVDTVQLFNFMCVRPIGESSHSSSTILELFTCVCQLMLTLLLHQKALFAPDLVSTCYQSLLSQQFLYDDQLKVELSSLLSQVCLHQDSIEAATAESGKSGHLIEIFVIVLSFLEHLPLPAISDSLKFINKSITILHDSHKMNIYLRCMQTSTMHCLWKICFQQLNRNLLCFFSDVIIIATDPNVSSLSSELHMGLSKLLASKIDGFGDVLACDEISCLLYMIKAALSQRPSECCFGYVGLISPPVLMCFHKEQPVMFQMATSIRGIQSALGVGARGMIVCNEAIDDAEGLSLSLGSIIEQTHEETIPNRVNASLKSSPVDFEESIPLLLLPSLLGSKFLPLLHKIVFSDSKVIQNTALDICCLMPSFDSSLDTHFNERVLEKFYKFSSSEVAVDVETFFSCFYSCGLIAAYSCNIGDNYEVVELPAADISFFLDFLAFCTSRLQSRPSASWNRLYLIGILCSLQCLCKCHDIHLSVHVCKDLLNLHSLFSVADFTTETKSLNTANCPVGEISLCQGILSASVSLAANVARSYPRPFFTQFLQSTLKSMPSTLLHAAYESVACLTQSDYTHDVLYEVVSACFRIPMVCKTHEFSRSFKLYSKVIPFLSRRPDFLDASLRVELLVSACQGIDSIDWAYCNSIRNGQTLICQFLHVCVLMLKIAIDNAQSSMKSAHSVIESVEKSLKSISCFVTADGGSCGLASFRGDASTVSLSARVSLSQLFSRIVEIFATFVPFDVILSVLTKNHQMYNPDFDLDSSAKQREFQAWPGFTNLGNTCYMNAVLQQLLSAPWFSHVVMSAKSTPADDCLLYECQKMIANHFYSDLAVTFTRSLVDVSKIWGLSIDCKEPHDAQEYLMSLLDQIGTDMLPEDKENLDGLFHGEISSQVTHGCKLGHISLMKGSFVSLSLNIDGIESIHDCIQSTLRQEDIAVDCAQCIGLNLEACREASKKDLISACPPLLVIHLKRFLFDISSDSRHATVLKNVPSIPSVLDLTPFLTPDCPDFGLYDLHGIVLHIGSLEYGHYTSVFSHESPDSSKAREWLYADDHKVSVLSEDEVQSLCDNQGEEKEGPLPYLIFFKKRNAHVFPKFKSSVFTLSPGKAPPNRASMHSAFTSLPKGEDILRRIETLVLSGKDVVSEEPKEISHLVASTVRHMKRSQASRFMYNAEYMELICKLVRCCCSSDSYKAAELSISYLLHVLAPHARPSQLHSFKVTAQVITECFKSSEEFLLHIVSELTKAKALVSTFLFGFREIFVEGLLFLQSVIVCADVPKFSTPYSLFADSLFNSCLREIMQSNLPPVFLINALLQTSWAPSASKLSLLANPVCKCIIAACDEVDLTSDTNFNLLLDCGHSILTAHCIPAMGHMNKIDSLRALIPCLLKIETLDSAFCAAASLLAFPDPIALSLSGDLESAALEILHSSPFSPPQTVYQNIKAVLAISLKLWSTCGQQLLQSIFQQLLVLKSRLLPKNVFAMFAAFNQMTSDWRVSKMLRDRAAEVDSCIEWLLVSIHLQDPEESSDLLSISPFTSPVSDRSGTDSERCSIDRVDSAATKLAASVRASLSFGAEPLADEDNQKMSPTFSESKSNP